MTRTITQLWTLLVCACVHPALTAERSLSYPVVGTGQTKCYDNRYEVRLLGVLAWAALHRDAPAWAVRRREVSARAALLLAAQAWADRNRTGGISVPPPYSLLTSTAPVRSAAIQRSAIPPHSPTAAARKATSSASTTTSARCAVV
jgi:hypothetical protein